MQVIGVVSSPFDYVLKSFWGSHLKNIATHKGLFCAYPEATLRRRKMAISKITMDRELRAIEKYLDRGFHVLMGDEQRDIVEFGVERTSMDDDLSLDIPYSGGGTIGWVVRQDGCWGLSPWDL